MLRSPPIAPVGTSLVGILHRPAGRMAQDGCQQPEWQKDNQAFPYLMHHTRGGGPSSSYASARLSGSNAAEAGPSTSQSSDRTGTWNGPAPRGYRGTAVEAAPSETAASQQQDAHFVLLPGGTHMPLVGFGTYKVESSDVVRAALEAGYRHFDCASVYDNEAVVGEGLSQYIQDGRRDELFIVSKIWNDAHRPDAARASCEKSVADLGCGRLDLLLLHWPEAWLPGTQDADPDVTLQQTWEAMEAMVDAGLAKQLGVSNFSVAQVEALLASARIAPVVNQVELHPLLAQRKLVGVCLRKGVRCVAYGPLGHSKEDLLQQADIVAIAEEAGKSPAQVLLKWNVQRGVAVIPKASSPAHMKDNIQGLFEWRLSNEHKARIDALDCGKRMVNNSWHDWGNVEDGGALKPSVVL